MRLLAALVVVTTVCRADGLDTLTLVHRIRVDDQGTAGAVDGCAFSTKGDLVAASDNTGLTRVYRVSDAELVIEVRHNQRRVSGADGETNAIHFSPDDRYFLTGMNDTGCKVWELATGRMIKNLGRGRNTDGGAFSPDGKWLAVAHDDVATIYRPGTFEKVAEVLHPKTECNSIDWASDGSLLITGSDGACCKITRTADWEVLHNIDFGTNRVKSVRISPDDRLVAVSGQAGRCRVYRVTDGEMVADLPHESNAKVLPGDDDDGREPNVEAVAWSTDSRYLFTGGLYDGLVRVWRVEDWMLIDSFQGQAPNRQVECMAVNPDDLLATGGDEGYLYLFRFVARPTVHHDR